MSYMKVDPNSVPDLALEANNNNIGFIERCENDFEKTVKPVLSLFRPAPTLIMCIFNTTPNVVH